MRVVKSRWFKRDVELVQCFIEEALTLKGNGFYLRDLYAAYAKWSDDTLVMNDTLGKLTFVAHFETLGFQRADRADSVVRYTFGTIREEFFVPRPEGPTRLNWKSLSPETRAALRALKAHELEERRLRAKTVREERQKAREMREKRKVFKEDLILQEKERRGVVKRSWRLKRLIAEGDRILKETE